MFEYEIVAPESVAWAGKAGMVVLPASEGELGLLPHHMPIVAMLEPGVVRIYEDQIAVTQRIFVTGGFVSMVDNRCSILADETLDVSLITPELVAARKKAASDAGVTAQSNLEETAAARLAAIAQAMEMAIR